MWYSILFSVGVYSVCLGIGYVSYNLYSFVFDYNTHKDAYTQTDPLRQPLSITESESESETETESESEWDSGSEQDDFINDITYTEPNVYTQKLRKRKFNLIN